QRERYDLRELRAALERQNRLRQQGVGARHEHEDAAARSERCGLRERTALHTRDARTAAVDDEPMTLSGRDCRSRVQTDHEEFRHQAVPKLLRIGRTRFVLSVRYNRLYRVN